MQAVQIAVPRRRAYTAGDAFDVFGDGGTGTFDFAQPRLDRRVPLWPEAMPGAGHILDGHLTGRHLDAIDPDGHLEGVHLHDDHHWPAAPIVAETCRYMFGAFKHAVRMYDAQGNASADAPAEVTTVINSSPLAPRGFAKDSYDKGAGRMVMAFTPSEAIG